MADAVAGGSLVVPQGWPRRQLSVINQRWKMTIAAELSTCKLAARLVPLLYDHSTLSLWSMRNRPVFEAVGFVLLPRSDACGPPASDSLARETLRCTVSRNDSSFN